MLTSQIGRPQAQYVQMLEPRQLFERCFREPRPAQIEPLEMLERLQLLEVFLRRLSAVKANARDGPARRILVECERRTVELERHGHVSRIAYRMCHACTEHSRGYNAEFW